jgi:hypothetical protein
MHHGAVLCTGIYQHFFANSSQGVFTSTILQESFEQICHNATEDFRIRSVIWIAVRNLLQQGKKQLEHYAEVKDNLLDREAQAHALPGLITFDNMETSASHEPSFLNTAGVTMATTIVGGGPIESMSPSSQCGDIFKESCDEKSARITQNLCEEGHDKNTCGKGTTCSIIPVSSGNVQDLVMSEKLKMEFCRTNRDIFEQAAIHELDCNSLEVDIMEWADSDDQQHCPVDQATECSFESTDSGFESETGVDRVLRGVEVESNLRDGNGASVPQEDEAEGTPNERNSKALDADWKLYRRGIEWRCRWLELRMQELQSQASRYDQILEELKKVKTWRLDRVNEEVSAARTVPLDSTPQKHRLLSSKQHRKPVDLIDIDAYMARHPLFSRYDKKRRQKSEDGEEKMHSQQNQQTQLIAIKVETLAEEENPVEQPVAGHEVGELESMEQLLWQIEALQARVEKAKHQLNQGAIPCRNSLVLLPKSAASNLSPQVSQVTLQPSSVQPFRVSMSDTSVGTPVLCNSNLVRSSSGHGLVGKRSSDNNIDNTVRSANVGVKDIEQVRHEDIKTPQWRLMEDADLEQQTQNTSSDEVGLKYTCKAVTNGYLSAFIYLHEIL